MVTEFDLPCSDCGHDLARVEVVTDGSSLTVAECPNCGVRHYPESALGQF